MKDEEGPEKQSKIVLPNLTAGGTSANEKSSDTADSMKERKKHVRRSSLKNANHSITQNPNLEEEKKLKQKVHIVDPLSHGERKKEYLETLVHAKLELEETLKKAKDDYELFGSQIEQVPGSKARALSHQKVKILGIEVLM
jgi:hypothetical protein